MALERFIPKSPDANIRNGQDFEVAKFGHLNTIVEYINNNSAKPAGLNGYVQFNNNNALGADADLFWDNTNKYLGIGNTTPAYQLSLSKQLYTQKGAYLAIDGSTTSGVGNYVGIGTTSPTALLHLVYTYGQVVRNQRIGDSLNGAPTYENLKSGGVPNALTAVLANTNLGQYTWRGSTGATTQGLGARLQVWSLENFTTSSYGSRLDISVTQLGTTTEVIMMNLRGTGVNIGNGINDLGARLGITGSGSTSATTALLVQNSGGTNLLQVKDNGDSVIYGDNITWGQGFGYLLRQGGGIVYGSNHNSVILKSAVHWSLQNNSGFIGASNGTIDYSSTNTPNVEQTNILRASQYQHGVGEGRFLIQAQANPGGYNAIGNMYIAGGRNTNGGAHGNVYLGVDLTGALGNVGIGTTTLTARLQVKSSGTTAATTSLLTQNSAGTTTFSVGDDGNILVGANTIIFNNNANFNKITSNFGGVTFDNDGVGSVRCSFTNGRFSTNDKVGFGAYNNTSSRVLILGSGSTSATTSLLVQNSGGTTGFSVRDDSSVLINSRIDSVDSTILFRAVTSTALTLTASTTTIGNHTAFSSGFFDVLTNGTYNFRHSSSNNSFVFRDPTRVWFYSTNSGTLIQNTSFGGTAIEASALFEVQSTNKGFLPPRMTTAQKNAIATPAAGLVIYDTDLNKLCVYTTAWQTITSV